MGIFAITAHCESIDYEARGGGEEVNVINKRIGGGGSGRRRIENNTITNLEICEKDMTPL